ncbi:MAG: diguanylate cyclase [Chloroflexi bacterium]|nr:diguanylate cyclase [Chloroflexota bacterium]
MNTSNPSESLVWIDPLTGCQNHLSLSRFLAEEYKSGFGRPVSLVSIDINYFAQLNASAGRKKGDAVLRWMVLVLLEETQAPVFRLGGDEFVVMLSDEHVHNERLARAVFDRLNVEAGQFGVQPPVAAVTVIHYDGSEPFAPAEIFLHLTVSIFETKANRQQSFRVIHAREINLTQISANSETSVLYWMSNMMLERMTTLGRMLEEAQTLATTDPVTGLPNLRAAQNQLTSLLREAAQNFQSLGILMIDGDDLREYNKISYAAGDEMLRALAETLRSSLRPGDFLARWRVGDEFLILLPETNLQQAAQIGRRLCQHVERSSQAWLLPVTISIGAAAYPETGLREAELLDQAETANARAKRLGKNRVELAPISGSETQAILHGS